MADESVLRLRIEADTTGLQTGLNRAEGEMGQFATETRKVEQQLKETAAAADKASTEFVKLADKSHASFGQMTVAFTGATVAGNALLAALDGLTRGLAAPVLEILDAEESAALLAGTFQGLQSDIDKVTTLAKELSAIGPIFDDDNLSRAAAQLRLFGANADAIQELLPYVNNLAMAFGIDVADAAKLVGQALNGQVRALGNLVPEIRTATSQTEVLAAIQGTAARNAQIAEQRMAGLGGQLALVKRQLGDAAQAFGNLLLPAMQQVLSFINANMMPALGKLAGAFVAIQTYFANLGKGLDLGEITRRVGEAIIRTEESFAKVEPRIVKAVGNIKGALKDLTLQGTFAVPGAGAGTRADAARPAAAAANTFLQQVQGAIDVNKVFRGGEAGLRRLFDRFGLDANQPKIGVDLVQWQRAKNLLEDSLKPFEAARARQRAEDERAAARSVSVRMAATDDEADRMMRAAEDAAKALSDAIQDGVMKLADLAAGVLGKILAGQEVTAREGAGIVSAGAVSLASVAGTLLGGPAVGALASQAASAVTKALAPAIETVVATTTDTIGRFFATERSKTDELLAKEFQATDAARRASVEQFQAAARLKEAATAQMVARENDRTAAIGQATTDQRGRIAALQGGAAEIAFNIGRRLAPTIGIGETPAEQQAGATLARVTSFLSGKTSEELGKLGKQASEIFAGGKVNKELADSFLASLGMSDIAGTLPANELLLSLAEWFRTQGAQPEAATIQQGTSPDRPVYVFDVRPRDAFAFAPESFFFRNRGADTSRAVAGSVPLPAAQSRPLAPRQSA